MSDKHISIPLILVSIFLAGCGKCGKLDLIQKEKDWVDHFKKGQFYFYKNSKGQTDTVEILNISDRYTPCNKIELSKYQYEEYFVLFTLRSNNNYNGNESSIGMTTEEWKQRIPYIYFGNLGPHRNDLENQLPLAMDTTIDGIKLTSIYYYADDVNTEQYGERKYFKNFYWNKEIGLVAYTALNNDLFIQTPR